MPLSLYIEGLDEFRNNVSNASGQINELVSEAMTQATEQVKNTAQDLAPFKTGNLKRSIYSDISNNGFTGTVHQDPNIAPYGAGIEFGTRPHDIVAVNKKVLADRSMNIIFGKIVHHPGNAPMPFMEPALENNLDIIQGFFHDAVQKLLDLMTGK